MTRRVLAIIPAKAHSRRVPGKNLRMFRGRPLLSWTVEAAMRSGLVDEVFVSTDSDEIRRLAESCGAQVPFLRPPELAEDHVHAVLPIIDMLEKLGGASRYSYCASLLPTSPLLSHATIDEVVRLSMARDENVLSVTPFGKTLFHLRTISSEGRLERTTTEIVKNVQTQDAPPLYYLNGAAYCAPVRDLLHHGTFQYGSPLAFVMNAIEAFDIDTSSDFAIAERLAGFAAER
ncbi:MAG: hypothetical protein AB7L71_01945 [Vicinamibacterales bacterium]